MEECGGDSIEGVEESGVDLEIGVEELSCTEGVCFMAQFGGIGIPHVANV